MLIRWVGIGEVKAAGSEVQLGCILGSCVSTVLWQPERRYALMSHILLPPQAGRHRPDDLRFADTAWQYMCTTLGTQGIRLSDCRAFITGGARILNTDDIGRQNVIYMQDLIDAAGVRIVSQHTGGVGHRSARFNPATGLLAVSFTSTAAPGTPARDTKENKDQ